MEVIAATEHDLDRLSELSVSLGNVPFILGQCKASLLMDAGQIVGFAAVQSAQHAAGSWVKEEYRRGGHTYGLRRCLENEMRRAGIGVYFSIPGSESERQLFAKYGAVDERLIQVKKL